MLLSRSLVGLLLIFVLDPMARAEVKLLLPQERTAFQTNEWIDISVVRRNAAALPASPMELVLHAKDGSEVRLKFTAPALVIQGKEARGVEHLHVNGALLRPGNYLVEVKVDNTTAVAAFDVYTHLRQSSFKLVNWGRAAKPEQQRVQGEDGLGFNVFYGHYGADEKGDLIRAGVDYIANCVMSGGHQMDLRLECDWSDPLVTRGGTRRVVKRALIDRTRPNVPGVHFYDEPGLTWEKHPITGEFGPHGVTAQVRSYKSAFDKEPIDYTKLDPKNPEDAVRWRHWITWRLGFMDAAWREAQFGVTQVRPDFISLTQSQYGWSAFTDGYYFNVARSLPITSGHGGYHDFGPGVFNPSFFLEMARARDLWKPCWYLPTWYGNTTADQFRLEQYLSFQTNIQGMIAPPDLEPALNASARAGIVESNQLMKRLGPIFTTMAPTRPPVAMLYSLSQAIHTQTLDHKRNYAHDMPQGHTLPFTYLAGKLIHQPFLAVVEEDILDGTLANEHKAVVISSLDYLDPKVVRALESFIRGGGLVLMSGDTTVSIKGAINLKVTPKLPDAELLARLQKEKGKEKEAAALQSTAKYLAGAWPLAAAIQAELTRAGIKPILDCDNKHVVVTRQAAGDIEYFFAVNATPAENDPSDVRTALRSAEAKIAFPRKGTLYDAVVGGVVAELGHGKVDAQAVFRFGPGQMRVFACSSRPIGGIKLGTPIVHRDLVVEKEPITLDVAAALLDKEGRLLSGSAPLHIRVVDSLGATRHDLYQATKLGQFSMRLPLAANDPPGAWKVFVSELLNNSEDVVTFHIAPLRQAPAIGGATPRAVFLAADRDNAFRFARTHHEVTLVKGKSPFNDAAAKRLAKVLEPWGMRCKEMDLAAASKARALTEEEARTFVGINYASKGQIKAGDANPASLVGYAVQGPVILLGNPDDNPVISQLAKDKFLPYQPSPTEFPGPGRGMFAWQRDALGAGQESITLIAYDEAGMSEAVGSFYEAVAGMEPLTRWTLPEADALVPAKSAPLLPTLPVAWTVRLPDRVESIQADARGLAAVTHDGSRSLLTLQGKLLNREPLTAPAKAASPSSTGVPEVAKKLGRSDRLLHLVETAEGKVALAYWGGTLRIMDRGGKVLADQQMSQDISAITWVGRWLIIGLADGRVQGLEVK